MTHEEYLKRRDELLKIRMESFDSFDKAILSLATGSLALSITFLDKIGKPYDVLTISLIFISWVAFFLVIVANLLSYLFASRNMDKKIDTLDKNFKLGNPDGVEEVFWERAATNICNFCAFVFFVFGVAAFVFYIGEIQMQNFKKIIIIQENEREKMTEEFRNGKTEIKAAVVQKVVKELHTAGITETPQAVIKPVVVAQPLKEGKTEAPKAVSKPSVNTQQNTSQEKK